MTAKFCQFMQCRHFLPILIGEFAGFLTNTSKHHIEGAQHNNGVASMYHEFFGLNRPPFRITPDPRFFFQGCDRGAILEALRYAIAQGEGIIKVVGEVGTGKTMICRMLPQAGNLPVDWVYLAHPGLSPEHSLHAIARELGVTVTSTEDKLTIVARLQKILLERHARGRQVVVLIEEAQGMPLETLEEIRLLSNLETEEEKLMQIVLFGQPELDDNLANVSIRQLRERITQAFYLSPLAKADIRTYLDHRLRAAGYTGPELFTPRTIRLINRYSQGLVRRVNILADKALLRAFSQGRHTLKSGDIRGAARDSQFTPPAGFRFWRATPTATGARL